MFKSGYIAILGRPNVGKSTLLNAFIGEKIAAVTAKPQTTRHRILGIKTLPQGQLLFLDTPGIHQPHKTLNQYMVEVANLALEEADLILFLIEPRVKVLPEERTILERVRQKGKKALLVVTKVDTVAKEWLLPVMETWQREFSPEAIIPIAAPKRQGLNILEREIWKRLPEGPSYFPEDQVSDVSERFLASETIREKAMALLHEEIPYSLAVVIEEYREPQEENLKKIIYIQAALVVERESQKGIVIGKEGQMIKRIGQRAREEIEARLGQKVFLELFVRVEKDWTKDPQKVRELAYS